MNMTQTSWKFATHAVVGSSKQFGQGVVGLFDNEFQARKMKKEIQKEGGQSHAKICNVEDGELSEENKQLKDNILGLS